MATVIPFPVPLPPPDWAAIDAAVQEAWPGYLRAIEERERERETGYRRSQFPPRLRLVK